MSDNILRSYISEVVHGAGADYLAKESIKDELQRVLEARIAAGAIVDQAGLNEFFATVDMATKALKMIPLDVWRAKNTSVPKKARRRVS